MKKHMIALYQAGEKGKTETIRSLAHQIIKAYPSHKIIYSKPTEIPVEFDFTLVIEINGVIIGLESQGDPKTNLKGRLSTLAVEFSCDLIFCCTRTRGQTMKDLWTVAKGNDYEVIWTSTHETYKPSYQPLLNELKAKQLIELVQTLKII